MYIRPDLRVRWNYSVSYNFNTTNGMKQGGAISPTLFCIYMNGLLNELELCGVSCHVGAVFAGAAYADDLALLSPGVGALQTMVDICNDYAHKYDIKFNAKKCQLIIFKCDSKVLRDPVIRVNGDIVKIDNEIVQYITV